MGLSLPLQCSCVSLRAVVVDISQLFLSILVFFCLFYLSVLSICLLCQFVCYVSLSVLACLFVFYVCSVCLSFSSVCLPSFCFVCYFCSVFRCCFVLSVLSGLSIRPSNSLICLWLYLKCSVSLSTVSTSRCCGMGSLIAFLWAMLKCYRSLEALRPKTPKKSRKSLPAPSSPQRQKSPEKVEKPPKSVFLETSRHSRHVFEIARKTF